MSAATREAIVWQRGADLRDDKMHYNWAGRSFPSVTSILGPVTGDFLFVHRAAISKLVCQLAEEGRAKAMHERWTECVVAETGEVVYQMMPCSPSECLTDGEYIANAGMRYMKACAERGTTIHDLLGMYAQGALQHASAGDIVALTGNIIEEEGRCCKPEDVAPYALSLWRWLCKYQPRVWFSEFPCFSDEHGYAGTADAVMLLGDDLYLVDLKTSDSFRRGWMAQVAAYAHAEFVVVDRTCAIEAPMPRLGDKPLPCAVLMVTEERAGMRAFDPVPAFREMFLPALSAWRANSGKVGITLPPQAVWDAWEVTA